MCNSHKNVLYNKQYIDKCEQKCYSHSIILFK